MKELLKARGATPRNLLNALAAVAYVVASAVATAGTDR